VPAPPGPDATAEELCAYYDKYDLVEQERAGHLKPVESKHRRELAESVVAYRKRAQVNVSLDQDQFVKLERLAKRKHLSIATLARCWVLERLSSER
jgi:hypothetical protein